MKLCSPEECTGCFACYNSCAHKAIEMNPDKEGFYAPVVLEDKCTDCGLCEKSCPVLSPIKKEYFEQYGYAAWNKDKKVRKESSSGGFFTEVASSILRQGGCVAGAVYDENFKVKHTIIFNIEELNRLRGSKYAQSNIGNTFVEIKRLLKTEVPVLFSGTPCQVAGLYRYLRKRYENLYTIDLVCHGVPSPLIFEQYKEYLTKKHKINKITNINMRRKKTSWCFYCTSIRYTKETPNGASLEKKEYIGNWFKDPFTRLFLREYILHSCCYDCEYKNMQRMGDITMSDFWGYKSTGRKDRNTDEGISMILVNSENGKMLFEQSKEGLVYFPRTAEEISKSQQNLSASCPCPENREEFWQDYNNMAFETIIEKYGYPEKRNISQWIISELGLNLFTRIIIKIFRTIWKQ